MEENLKDLANYLEDPFLYIESSPSNLKHLDLDIALNTIVVTRDDDSLIMRRQEMEKKRQEMLKDH
jgi:hypothetical protein